MNIKKILILLTSLVLVIGCQYRREVSIDGHQYAGEFRNGNIHGQGIVTLEDGTKLEGQWENNGLIKGRVIRSDGIEYSFEGQLVYIFRNLKKREIVGAGTAVLPDGRKYTGSINKYGHFQGQGTMFYPSGRQEKGLWENSKLFKSTSDYDDGWIVSNASEEGMSLEKLSEMKDRIIQNVYKNIHSVIIIKNGKLVFEEYFYGYSQEIKHALRSATKSIGSILTGIAIDQHYIPDVNHKIYPYFKEYEPEGGWDSKMKEVTIKNLLNMTSGYDCDDWIKDKIFYCERNMYKSNDWVEYALNLPMTHHPGKHWAYNSASLILVGEIISKTSNMSMPDFADKHLFGPLGITDFKWGYSPKGRACIAGNAKMRPRDMAKFGYMVLNNGKWKGNAIVSRDWLKESTGKHYSHYRSRYFARHNINYGYLWWHRTFKIKNKGSNNIKNIETIYASGNGGQLIYLFPTLDLVVVFTGGNYNSHLADQPNTMLKLFILPAIL